MITNLATVLSKAREKQRCVPAINVYNLETVQAVLAAASSLQAPIIVSFGEGYIPHAPLKIIAAIVNLLDSTDRPVVLHLDHAKKLRTIEEALDCGFTSVMFDGSHLPLAQNIADTQKVVALAARYGASVEGELGYLNPEDGSDGEIYTDRYTGVEDASIFVAETGVDALAIAVGNAHGLYSAEPQLDFKRIADIAEAVNIPLVLHGSSGIPEKDLKQAIALGISKINVNTEVALAGSAAASAALQEHQGVRFESVMKRARDEMTEVVKNYLRISGFLF